MIKPPLWLFSIILFVFVLSGCSSAGQSDKTAKENQQVSSAEKVELTVSAAASLQNALIKIKANFEKEHPHVKISFNFGSSGSLQQQIAQGAPVDLFFSAAEEKFDQLVNKDLIMKEKRLDLLGNELVLIVPKDADMKVTRFEDLRTIKTVSIGTPELVPAGKYAQETLENLKLWTAVKGKMVYAKDVRQVLTCVETGNVDAGIVYKTDALVSSKVKVAASAGGTAHEPIIYPLGVIKNSSHPKEAELFYSYLQTKESLQIFEKHGFKGLK